ncbi:MAG: hypothetical protein KBE01_09070 [Synergistaceae bacterium]|nr:hypothetical protein [Synergistaceae bacterium]
MHVWGFTEDEKVFDREGIELLPDLTEDVLFEDVLVVDIEQDYTAGMDEWWSDFVSDMFL